MVVLMLEDEKGESMVVRKKRVKGSWKMWGKVDLYLCIVKDMTNVLPWSAEVGK